MTPAGALSWVQGWLALMVREPRRSKLTATSQTTEQFVDVAGGRGHILKGGTGDPLLVLHRDTGNPGWLPFYDQLAQRFTVHIPSYPGYGTSDRPVWMRSVRDMAVVLQRLVNDLKLGSFDVVGLGYGGWIAAEMATMCHHQFRRMVLAGPMGVQPEEGKGEIFDQFLVNTTNYTRTGFYDQDKFDQLYGHEPVYEQLDIWEINREMTSRIGWKPYMFNQQMPYLIKGVDVPTLIVWGREDRVVPLNCGERYRDLMPNARLEVIDQCGHYVEVERPEQMAKLVLDFLK